MKEIVQRINEVKDHYRLSGRALAARIGMTYTTINNYLNGTKAPSLEFVVNLKSTFVGISMDWLLAGEGSMFKSEDAPTNEELMKELADAKVQILVNEGVIKELKSVIYGKLTDEQKSLVG